MEPPQPYEANGPARAALAYAARGWQVLPLWWPASVGRCACGLPDCDSIGKHPIHLLVPHGLHDATSQAEAVIEWWRSVPDANVGVRTGAESGPVVLDIDGQAGRLALHALVETHIPFRAQWVRTGGYGWHAYFTHPGTLVSNSSGHLGIGLDVRGDGGYVVAPPSLHGSGRRYHWISLPDGELPPMPVWILDLVKGITPAGSAPRPLRLSTGHVAAYASAALEAEVLGVATAPAGQRNHRLNRAAFKLGQLVGAGLLDEAPAVAALVAAGLAAGPGERKIRSTVRRGLLAGMRHPRHVVHPNRS